MKKWIAALLSLLLTVGTLPVFAADATAFAPFELPVSRIGQNSDGKLLRLVVDTSKLPIPFAENNLVGARVTGSITSQKTQKVYPVDAVVQSNEAKGIIVIPMVAGIVVDSQKDENYQYALTLSPASADLPSPSPTAAPTPSPTVPPTVSPTPRPTAAPTSKPTASPVPRPDDEIAVLLNGAYLTFDVPPMLVNDRTLVPMRAIFEALGADIQWDETTQTVTGTKGDTVITVQIDNPILTVNGEEKVLDQAAGLFQDRTLVPVRAISESFSCEVNWDEATQTVHITSQDKDINSGFDLPDEPRSYFIIAAAFDSANLGTFALKNNAAYYNETVLEAPGLRKPEDTQNASLELEIDKAGTYSVWGHSRDYATNQPGTRVLQLMVNGTLFDQTLGTHGEEGMKWTKVGDIKLEAGKTTIEVVDTANFYGRLDGIFLTSNPSITPVEDYTQMCEIADPIGAIDLSKVSLPPEYHVRDGLANFFEKVKSGEPVNVGYIGGSNTQSEGYRTMSFAWLQEQFAPAKFNLVSAGVSGTCSDLGALRIKQDIMEPQCDLVFIEFAGNDTGRLKNEIMEDMEGMVRQIWTANPKADIIFVYTMHAEDVGTVQRGKYTPSATAMEEVAQHYGIPSVFMGVDIVKMITEGTAVFKGTGSDGDKFVFSSDGTHPVAEGHRRIYTEAIKRAIVAAQSEAKTAAAHVLPAPLVSDTMANVTMLDPREASPSAGWTWCDPASNSLAKTYSYMFNGFLRAENPGEALTFRFKGTELGIYDVGGPDAGQLIINIDGKDYTMERFTVNSYRNRPQYAFLPEKLEDTEHTVTITLGKNQADKETIMKNAGRTYDAAAFDHTVVNIGKILVIGEVL